MRMRCVDQRSDPINSPTVAGRFVRATAVSILVVGLVACSPERVTSTTRSVPAPNSALDDAPRLVALAVQGVGRRPEQDRMLQLEARLPGFGGFYIDGDGQVVAIMKTHSGTPAARVRAVLHGAYASRPEAQVREAMSRAGTARIVEGSYSLSELVAIENRILRSRVPIPGITGLGVSILRNRVKVGFADANTLAQALPVIQSIGVPLDGILPEVWGEVQPIATWNSRVRPTRAGLRLHVANATASGQFVGQGSHGYNVLAANGLSYSMIASHVANNHRGINGVTGDTIFQPWRAEFDPSLGGPTARVVINPPWQDMFCGPNPSTGTNFDFCTSTDVALATFIGGATGERRVGISTYEGANGAAGTPEIQGWHTVQGVAIPEFVQVNCCGVHKSGFTTGTTTGEIDVLNASVFARIQWGPTLQSYRWILYENLVRVAHAGWGFGDSGGPVFARKVRSDPFYALGIIVTATPAPPNATEWTCDRGTECAFYFSRWSNIETAIGIGTLNPATSGSPPPPPPPPGSPFPVSIDGPAQIPPGATCTWYAVTAGGTGPYTYQWTINSSPVGGNDYFFTGSKPVGSGGTSFVLKVVVTDSGNGQGQHEITVTEDSSAQGCMT